MSRRDGDDRETVVLAKVITLKPGEEPRVSPHSLVIVDRNMVGGTRFVMHGNGVTHYVGPGHLEAALPEIEHKARREGHQAIYVRVPDIEGV